MMSWSKQQEAIFGWFANGTGNLVVRARAGTGKTTSILEAVARSRESKGRRPVLLCAFNKEIAVELVARLNRAGAETNVEAKTMHSAGFRVVRERLRSVKIDDDRGGRIAREVAGGGAPDDVVKLVQKIARIGKNCVPLDTTVDELVCLAEVYDLEPEEKWEDDGWTTQRLAALALAAMDRAAQMDEKPCVDFDDMIFVPLRNGWVHGRYALVVVDECQDMNTGQLLLAQQLAVEGASRIAVVGDDRQAIYGFRGAASNALDSMKRALNAEEMGLTTTYRCASLIVGEAKRIVPDYGAAPDAILGAVSNESRAGMVKRADAGDFVLSRTNAPLVTACLAFLKAGKRARIRGRDVGAALVTTVRKIGNKSTSIAEFIERLETASEKDRARTEKRAKKRKWSKDKLAAAIDAIDDRESTLTELCDGLTSPAELVARITALFSDDPLAGGSIMLSSVHRAKGLETERAWLIGSSFMLRGKNMDHTEELNLCYVAITRAKNEVVWVDEAPPLPVLLSA